MAIVGTAILGPSAWLSAACVPAGQRAPKLQQRAADGRLACLVELACNGGVASHVLLVDAGDTVREDVAVLDCAVAAMEWQGQDLMLGLLGAGAIRVFSVYPGMRLREAAGPVASTVGGLRWLRISTRRSRR